MRDRLITLWQTSVVGYYAREDALKLIASAFAKPFPSALADWLRKHGLAFHPAELLLRSAPDDVIEDAAVTTLEREYAWFSIMDALPITSVSAENAAHQIIRAAGERVARQCVEHEPRPGLDLALQLAG